MSRSNSVIDVLNQAIEAGQRFLLSAQRRNGSWSDSPWETAFCMISLIESGLEADNQAFTKAELWLMSQMRTDEHGSNWESFTWDTALVVRALTRLPEVQSPEEVDRAICWTVRQELEDLAPERRLFHYGYCYPAQTLIMLAETNRDRESQNRLSSFLKETQEPDGGWITDFDTAQIIEGLVRSGSGYSDQWDSRKLDSVFSGGIERAARWIVSQQTPGGGWSGLTLPAALMFRAYILATEIPDRNVVGLALTWFLHQICDDGSCFHEPARTGAMIETFRVLRDLAVAPRGASLHLTVSYDQFLASMDKTATARIAARDRELLTAGTGADTTISAASLEIGVLKKSIRNARILLAVSSLTATTSAGVMIWILDERILGVVLGVLGALPVVLNAIEALLKRLGVRG